MALVPCPECGKPMSSQAPSCPSCGYAGQVRPSAFAPVGGGPAVVPAVAAPTRGPEASVWEGRPSLKLLLVQVLRTLVIALAAVAAAIAVHPVASRFFADLSAGRTGRGPRDGSPATMVLATLVGAYLVVRAIVLTISVMQLRTTRYRITNQRVIIERGILSRALEEVDLRYVDDSGFTQSLLERLQGIGSVWIISSDKSMPRLTLRGIQDPRALRELVREHAYRLTQGQVFTRST
jgi:membrane protein YdbS with pleckstrin-like domain